MGLDDFAFCKGHTYGTLICDLQSKAPLALLPNRLPETVTSWLKKYPFIELVSRDGFTGFRQGIKDASNKIIQIYDRWHFIRNAKKQLDTFLSTLVPATIKWNIPNSQPTEIPLTRAEQTTKNRQSKKWELIQEIQAKHNKGKNISRLSRDYDLDRRTIYQYLKMKEPPVFHRFRNRPVDMYRDQVIKLEQAGNTVKEIFSTIQNLGYTGTYSGVRTVVEKFRKERNFGLSQVDKIIISRKKLCSWMWRPEEELEKEERSSLIKCFELYPPVKELYITIQTYRGAIQTRNLEVFLKWIGEQLSSKKNPFYYYALRLRSDLQAIKNALLSPFSNGLLEGQINRLKTIKRVTYGRAGLEILEKRVLYRL